jgi:hypothetical protein
VAALFSAAPVQVQTPRTVVTTQASTGQPVQCQIGGRDLGMNGGPCTWSHQTAVGSGGFNFGFLSGLSHWIAVHAAVLAVGGQVLTGAGLTALNFLQSAAEGGMAAVRQAGLEGEDLAGIIQAAKVRIPSLTGTAAYRIPDELTDIALTEVKNVASLIYTNQLRDFYWYANATGRSFNLIVRVDTILSSRLGVMAEAGVINIEQILP